MKITIKVGKKYLVCEIDEKDQWVLSEYRWSVLKGKRGNKYLVSTTSPKILLHRLLMGVSDSKIFVDHIDGNGLNNKRSNLRICTNQQNLMNKRIYKNNTSGMPGVYIRKGSKRWSAKVSIDGKEVRFGSYSTKEEAIYVRDQILLQTRGDFARLYIIN